MLSHLVTIVMASMSAPPHKCDLSSAVAGTSEKSPLVPDGEFLHEGNTDCAPDFCESDATDVDPTCDVQGQSVTCERLGPAEISCRFSFCSRASSRPSVSQHAFPMVGPILGPFLTLKEERQVMCTAVGFSSTSSWYNSRLGIFNGKFAFTSGAASALSLPMAASEID